jgi:hypothetical protein
VKKSKHADKPSSRKGRAPAKGAQSFAELAKATLAAAKLLAEARALGSQHSMIRERVAQAKPPKLRAAWAGLEKARQKAGEARHHYERAEAGRYCSRELAVRARKDPEGVLELLAQRRAKAEKVEEQALAKMRALEQRRRGPVQAWMKGDAEIVNNWLAELAATLAARRDEYRAALAEHEQHLAALDRSPAKLGAWGGTSYCDVLAQIADALVRRTEPGIDWDDWGALEIAVKKEAATVRRSKAPGRRKHAGGTLDERALATAKRWQADGRAWTVTELAAKLETYPACLTGKRGRKPRCPLFAEFWNQVQLQRADAKQQRRSKAT